jgi:hypothetical protein
LQRPGLREELLPVDGAAEIGPDLVAIAVLDPSGLVSSLHRIPYEGHPAETRDGQILVELKNMQTSMHECPGFSPIRK